MVGFVTEESGRWWVDGGWKDGRNVESSSCWEPDMEIGKEGRREGGRGLNLFK